MRLPPLGVQFHTSIYRLREIVFAGGIILAGAPMREGVSVALRRFGRLGRHSSVWEGFSFEGGAALSVVAHGGGRHRMGVDASVAVHQPDFGSAFLGLARLHTHRGEWDVSVFRARRILVHPCVAALSEQERHLSDTCGIGVGEGGHLAEFVMRSEHGPRSAIVPRVDVPSLPHTGIGIEMLVITVATVVVDLHRDLLRVLLVIRRGVVRSRSRVCGIVLPVRAFDPHFDGAARVVVLVGPCLIGTLGAVNRSGVHITGFGRDHAETHMTIIPIQIDRSRLAETVLQ